jgi:VanZ family protein
MARKRAHVNMQYWTTAALIMWVVVVFFVHVVPIDPNKARTIDIPHFDKLIHFTLFLVLALLALRRRVAQSRPMSSSAVWWIILTCCVYGIVLELFQPLAGTHRSSDVVDGMADVLGVLTGVISNRSCRGLLFFGH